jgi:hypothetical protein
MAKLNDILDAVRDHVREMVYAIEPAARDDKGEGWEAHNTESGMIMGAGERVRLFDVLPGIEFARPADQGSSAYDYYVPFEIVIVYGVSDEYRALIAGDYAAIYHALCNAVVSTVSGLNCYIPGDSSTVEDKDVRYTVIRFTAYVTAEG